MEKDRTKEADNGRELLDTADEFRCWLLLHPEFAAIKDAGPFVRFSEAIDKIHGYQDQKWS